jgi:hypothetical protein
VEHLPEREIPRHHGKDHANRIVRHEGFGPAEFHRLTGEVALGILGEVVAVESAFLDLGQTLLPGLAHLGCHDLGELRLPAPQHHCGLSHEPGPMGEGRAPPLFEGVARSLRDRKGLISRVPLVSPPALPCSWIGGLEARPLVRGIGRLAALRLVTLRRAGMLIHDKDLLDPIQRIARTRRSASARRGSGFPHQRYVLQDLDHRMHPKSASELPGPLL